MELNEKILKAIDEELPAQLGSVLKERLSQVESLERELQQEKRSWNTQLQENLELQEKVSKHEDLDEREKALDKREADVIERERKMELNEFKVEAADQRASDVKELASIVFRNPRLTTSTSSTVEQPDAQYLGSKMQLQNSEFRTQELG